MSADLPKSYTPSDWEDAIRARWDQARAFHADPIKTHREGAEPFCIVIPPPNVTAALHLGHAFNNTLQDVLVRSHRMMNGRDSTLWMPGTDHAGIATQAVVEKRLLLQGKRRTDFTREQFVEKVQAWKDEYEATILAQLKAMGCSCDYERTRFTMDDVCAKAVREAFFRLFKDGLIYRGKRLVNWDPASLTALADDEVEMEEVQGHMYYLRYPLDSSKNEFVTVATTRPETMLGDVAVAMNPKDPRAAQFVGKQIRLPIVDRVIPIIADDYVVRPVEFGGDENDTKATIATGFLKVTPAHDDNDYAIGQRHNLPIINVFAPDASISDKHGWADVSDESKQFLGLSREDARKKIVEWFKARDLLEKVVPYTHSVGHSYRSHVPIEPYLSDQWYVKVTDDRMRGEALRAMSQFESGGTGVSPVPPQKKGISETLQRTRRNLPHWQIGGSTYFITFRLRHGTMSDAERQIVADAARHWHATRMTLHLGVVMHDHVHLLLTPLPIDMTNAAEPRYHSLSDLLHSIKSFSAHEIQRLRGGEGPLWQDESFDRIMRDDEEFLEKWNYIRNNPATAGLARLGEEYAHFLRPEPGTGETPVPPATGDGDGTLTFYPARYAKTFQAWHENLRDWCISRQLWWGHRIPVWSRQITIDGTSGSQEELSRIEAAIFFEGPHQHDAATVQVVDRNSGEMIQAEGGLPWDYLSTHPGEYELHVCPQDWGTTLNNVGFVQDPDVLDTWFSSALWPISTMGWPDPDAFPSEIPEGSALLNKFNPSTVLCTAREIITLWVSRMVMFNRYLRNGTLPFRDVYIHAMIQDGHGQKMSKSLGNGVDPRDIIHSHGADALRFTLAKLATSTQDVRLPVDMICPFDDCNETFQPKEITTSAGYRVADAIQTCPKCKRKMVSGYGAATGIATPSAEMPLARNSSRKFDDGRNFANKVWNATRFALANLASPTADAHGLQSVGVTDVALVDKWILARLRRTLTTIEDALRDYQFNVYCDALYDFVWRDFCDWYLEAIKPTIKTSPAQQQVLRTLLNAIMRLLHPAMPFVTETLWPSVAACGLAGLDGVKLEPSDLLATASWPEVDAALDDAAAIAEFERVRNLVNAIRNLRAERQVPQKKKIHLAASPDIIRLIKHAGGVVEGLALLDRADTLQAGTPRPPGAIPFACEGGEVLLSGLVDELDIAAEKSRLTKVIAEKDRAVTGFRGKLSNEGYLSKAPPEKVEETRRMLAQAEADLEAARKAIQSLG